MNSEWRTQKKSYFQRGRQNTKRFWGSIGSNSGKKKLISKTMRQVAKRHGQPKPTALKSQAI